MKKKLVFLFIIAIGCCMRLAAQLPGVQKVAVLAPLYLDDAFDNYSYQLGNKSIPQYIIAGLDFYNGVMLAVDDLQRENTRLEVWVFDTKKQGTDISTMLKGMAHQKFSLIIASLNNTDEQKAVSDFSFFYNIPVVSATYPNDANVTDNPFFILLNSTLKTHVEGIYRYVQQNYATSRPVFITRSGSLESRILTDFKASDTKGFTAKYRTVTMSNDDMDFRTLAPYLDSTRTNVLVCGSLSADFAGNIARTLCEYPQFKTVLIGMPNWDGMRQLDKLDCNNLEVVYSTPFNYSRSDSAGYRIRQAYRSKFFARPSDMVYRGYETMYHFTRLLLDYDYDFLNHLSENKYVVANNFLIRPVMQPQVSFVPAYLENQHLYFVKKVNGSVVAISSLKR